MSNRESIKKPINVIVFGATGKTGIRLVQSGLALGHQVTAFVRNKEKLLYMTGGFIPDNLRIFVGDAFDRDAVGSAMEGHSAAVNVAAPIEYGDKWIEMCGIIVDQAEKHLDNPKRLWLFGGLPALDIPNTNIMSLDLPLFPPFYKIHKENYKLLLNSELDWSFMCPGPMGPIESFGEVGKLHVSTEILPYEVSPWVSKLPKICLSWIFLKRAKETVVPFEAVSHIVMSNLEGNGPYYKKRVGAALRSVDNAPKGIHH